MAEKTEAQKVEEKTEPQKGEEKTETEELKIEGQKEVVENIPTPERARPVQPTGELTDWKPKTSLGKKVKAGEIKDIAEILDTGKRILEAEIVDILLPTAERELLMIGQSKGKFGGGQKRVFRQTQKKTKEGNKPSFATYAVVGNKNGYVGLGYGKSKETVPAREKAVRNAKLHLFKIARGCGSWQCNCKQPHSIPFKVVGKCGSAIMKLIPAPKGNGLVIENECAKILRLAGITDVWSKTYGQTKQKVNLIRACEKALKQLIAAKVRPAEAEALGFTAGEIKAE